jgi:uncharacterized membrane protein YfcA
MIFLEIFADSSFFTIIALALLAFVAGFIDAIVGGGGLIQLPALLINFPSEQLPTLFGTNKIAALSGTSVAAYQYSKKIKFDFKLLIVVSIFAFAASFVGAKTVSYISVNTLKPVILAILILIAIYTFLKKDLGSVQTKKLTINKQIFLGSLIGIIVGFYDGFLVLEQVAFLF